jgi:lipopolysaccharide export system protein LptA
MWLMLVSTVNATKTKLIIDAAKFEINEAKGITIFKGNVKMTRGEDLIEGEKLEIYTTPVNKKSKKTKTKTKRQMRKFIATGKVKFSILMKDKHYKGRGNQIIYDAEHKKYTVIGNGYLEEKIGGTKLYGDKIFLDELSGKAKMQGSKKKPVRFIMNIDK